MQVVMRVTVTRGPKRHRGFPGLVQLRSGELLLPYREGSDHFKTNDAVVKATRSTDGGATWSEPVTILREAGWGFAAQHGPTQLADGSVLAPAMSIRKSQVWPRGEYRVYALRSHDEGRSWDVRQIGPMPGWRWQNQYGRVMEIDGAALLSDPRCPAGSPWPARVTVDDFKTLRELYREVEPTVAALDLTAEGVRYYANSVVKS